MKKTLLFIITLLLIIQTVHAFDKSFMEVNFVEDACSFYNFKSDKLIHKYLTQDYEWIEDSYTCYYKIKGPYLTARISGKNFNQELIIFACDNRHVIIHDPLKPYKIFCSSEKICNDDTTLWPVYDIALFDRNTILHEKIKNFELEKIPAQENSEIVIRFTNVGVVGSRKIYLINGYFNPENPDEFYDYSRIKKMTVICYDEYYRVQKQAEIFLEDTGELQLIQLDDRYKYLEFVVTDVYKGSKSLDIGITGIFADGSDVYKK